MQTFDYDCNYDRLDGVDYSEEVEDIAWRDRMRRESEIEEYLNRPYVWFE